jgi:hypothetical protein
MKQRVVGRKGRSLLSTEGDNATEQPALSDMPKLYKGRLSEFRLNNVNDESVLSGT